MNRKVLVIAVALMAVAMLATPLVSAVPGAPKTNEKFETWHYVKSLNFIKIIYFGEHVYIPSFENPNRMVLSATEEYNSFVITVDGHTYTKGVDFNVVGHVTMAFNNPSFANPLKLYPSDYKTSEARVELMLDFSAYSGGIEGTLHLLEMSISGQHRYTNSLEGTGDLRNVQVKGYWSSAFVAPWLTVTEDGTVIGWPE